MTEDNNHNWVDLHLHTDKSDGTSTPSDLVDLAIKHHVKTIAITDHDTVAGLEEGIAQGLRKNIKVIPGIEISSRYTKGTLHILGYGIDYHEPRFLEALTHFQEIRKTRNTKIINKLQLLGIDISISDIMKHNPKIKSLGRPHIASVLVDMGIVKNMDEAFEKYLGKQGKAFVSKEVLTSAETIRLIHRAGGLAFLAHPTTLKLAEGPFTEFLKNLLEESLDGIEVYSSAHNAEQIQFFLEAAQQANLFISAGSDFHGENKRETYFGCCNMGAPVSSAMVSREMLGLFAES